MSKIVNLFPHQKSVNQLSLELEEQHESGLIKKLVAVKFDEHDCVDLDVTSLVTASDLAFAIAYLQYKLFSLINATEGDDDDGE